MNKIFITGVSGLLGQALVEMFLQNDFFVYGHYFQHQPEDQDNAKWLQGDLSSLKKIRNFLGRNQPDLSGCEFLINNYGPITIKDISALTADDYCHDFFHNVLTAIEITDFFIQQTRLRSVINIGFENIGKIMPYKKVLPYAIAKNALLLITKSHAETYQPIRFNLVSSVSLNGASEILKKNQTVSPRKVAREIFRIIGSNKSGLNIMIK
ncbi:MAG: SDR family oxidoreductase [Candidatus Aminicenantes bacterium]|nr:SDR family oxidoreductase [Candidatus Aminicenantes bacterium]